MNNKQAALLKKIKALTDQGASGEKEAAEAILIRLMEKHNISWDELEEVETHLVWFRYYDDFDRRLLRQTIILVTGGEGSFYTHRNREGGRTLKEYGLDVTSAQEIELRARLDFYRAAYKEEQDIFFLAFIHKHRIFDPNDIDDSEPTEESMAMARRIYGMMQSMENKDYRKQLPKVKSVSR